MFLNVSSVWINLIPERSEEQDLDLQLREML